MGSCSKFLVVFGFLLWRYDVLLRAFRFHDWYVGIKLNMTA